MDQGPADGGPLPHPARELEGVVILEALDPDQLDESERPLPAVRRDPSKRLPRPSGGLFRPVDLTEKAPEPGSAVDGIEALAPVVPGDHVQVALPESELGSLALGIPPGVLVADHPGVDPVQPLGLLPDAALRGFDPDPVAVADAQVLGRLAVHLHQGVGIAPPELGRLVVLGMEEVGGPPRRRDEGIRFGQRGVVRRLLFRLDVEGEGVVAVLFEGRLEHLDPSRPRREAAALAEVVPSCLR